MFPICSRGGRFDAARAVFHLSLAALAAGLIDREISARAAPAPPAPPAPPPPLVIGRDPREPGTVIGKQFLLRVWLSNVGGPGVQRIHTVRVAADGNLTVPGGTPVKAEGATIAAVEQQVAAPYKATSPTATAWVSVVDRGPASAPATRPASAPAIAPAPATQSGTQPAPVPATQPGA